MAEKISKKDANVKKMADLLRGGATMMAETCPDCNVPIFKLKSGEMVCPGCDRRVVFAKSTEAEALAAQSSSTSELERVMSGKVDMIRAKMEKTDDPKELEDLSKSLSSLLDALEKVRQRKP